MKKLFLPIGALALYSSAVAQQQSDRPNVLLIYADDIGYGDLSCNGTSAVRTPNVEKLASEGIRFTNAHCAAATSTPSRYAMLTGEYAWRRKGTGIAAGNAAMIITPDRYTMADMFKEAGYQTGVVGKWHLGLGNETGKQDWNGVVKPNPADRIGYMKGGKSALWRDEDIADSITTHAIRFIENSKRSGEPFFLYLATNDIHVPRVPHERFAGKSGLGPRGDALLSFDWTVGQVMETLKKLNLDDNTIIILSSDNGAVIDDGYKDQAVELLGNHKATGVYRGGKYSSYEGGTRVPCVIRWKGKIPAGVSDNLVSQIDWFASFASMCGVNLPEGSAPDSENHLDSWLKADVKGRSWAVEQNLHNNLSITDGVWKYIPAANGPAVNKQTNTELGNNPKADQLYNLLSDPGEHSNVAEENKELVQKMRDELIRIVESGLHIQPGYFISK